MGAFGQSPACKQLDVWTGGHKLLNQVVDGEAASQRLVTDLDALGAVEIADEARFLVNQVLIEADFTI